MSQVLAASAVPRKPARAVGPNPAYALPALGFFALFALLPMVIVIYLSLTKWNGIAAPHYIGIQNWTAALHDGVTRHAVTLTVIVMVLSWLVQTPISLLLGVYLAEERRYKSTLSVLLIVPLLVSSAAAALTWKSMLDPNFGGVSEVFSAVGLTSVGQRLLVSDNLIILVIVAIIAWQFVPLHTLLYKAAARQIPTQLYEAASLDGASNRQQFFLITIPQLRNTIVTSSMLILVGSLTYFDVVFIMTGGGPGYASRLLPLDMYLRGFQQYDLGYASVVATVLTFVGIALSMAISRLAGFGRMESARDGL